MRNYLYWILEQERDYLDKYLPTQLSRDEIEKIAIEQEVLGQNFGQIMGFLKKTYAGKYDPQFASQIIKEVIVAGSP